MNRLLGAALALLFASNIAFAQSVQQSGTVTPGHVSVWVATGVIGDGGTAANGSLTSLGITASGQSLCINSAASTSGAYQQFCLGATTAGGATISLQNLGSAPAETINFDINGTSYPFPGGLSQIIIGTTPVSGGTNGQCLYVASGFVGQQNCTLTAITSLTGDVTATGPGITTATLATVNSSPGTYGSGALVPIVTVNAKGLSTTITTAAVALTVGSTSVGSGGANQILYEGASGLLDQITGVDNAVLITNGTALPSLSTTLPSSLTIPSPAISSPTISSAAVYSGTNEVTGGLFSPTGNGQGTFGATSTNGGEYGGQGSTYDASLVDNGGSVALGVLTGTTTIKIPGGLTLSGLSSGTCDDGLAINSSSQTVLVACPGSASSIQVGSTSVTSASASNDLLTTGTVSGGTGTLANVALDGSTIKLSGSTISVANTTVGQATCTPGSSCTPESISSIFGGNGNGNLSTSSDNYFWIGEQCVTEAACEVSAPVGGTLSDFNVITSNDPGGSASYTFTLRVAGSSAALTCTVTGSATSCSDTTHSVSVTAQQTLDIESVPSGSPTTVGVSISFKFQTP